MKKILNLITLFSIMACSSQTPIINITEQGYASLAGAYYKDVNNLLNPFEGTYIYTSGNTTFKIILVKKTMAQNSRYYEDLIIGEYQYIENGIERINTLSTINIVYPNQIMHSINANGIMTGNSIHHHPRCADCTPTEKRLFGSFGDNSNDTHGTFVARKVTVGTQEAIRIKIRLTSSGVYVAGTTPPPSDFTVPSGEYTLIKQ